MSAIDSFETLHHYFMNNYLAGNYEEALKVVNENPFPADAAITQGWKMAMLAKLNRVDEALAAFEEALDAGNWYLEGALRGDSDFASLQGNARFNELIKRNNMTHSADKVTPRLSTFEPNSPSKKLIIALHGNAGNATSIIPVWKPAIEWGWIVALPQSGQSTWLSGHYVWDKIEQSVDEVRQAYHSLIEKYQPETVVIAGFSMGGAIALSVAAEMKLRKVLLLETYPDSLQAIPSLEVQPPLQCHVFWGIHDLEASKTALAFLESHQIPYEYEETANTAHAYPPDFGKRLQKLLTAF
jgi:predicted esterase